MLKSCIYALGVPSDTKKQAHTYLDQPLLKILIAFEKKYQER